MNNPLQSIRFNRYFRLKTKQVLSLLSALLMVGFDARASKTLLPENQPDREWGGSAYADAVLGSFYQAQKDAKVSFDFTDLPNLSDLENDQRDARAVINEVNKEYRTGDSGYLQAKIVNSLKNVFPEQLRELLNILEQGSEIKLNSNDQRLLGQLDLWIMDQPEKSIYPHELMSKALELSKGKAFLAWALAWNLMREDWQAAPDRNYGERINKFASLTGERSLWQGGVHYIVVDDKKVETGKAYIEKYGQSERKEFTSKRLMKQIVTKRGDEFSYIYHRIGVELFTMVIAKYYGYSTIGRLAGMAGAIGEWFKYRKTAGLEAESQKRVNNDLFASISGQRLFELITRQEKPLQGQNITAESYLKPNPQRYGSKYQVPSDRPSTYFGSKLDPKYWNDEMSVEELKKRFFHAMNYDANVFDMVILGTSGDYLRLHRGLSHYIESGAKDAELNALLKDYHSGIRAYPETPDIAQDVSLSEYKNLKFIGHIDPEFDFDIITNKINRLIEKAVVVAQPPKISPVQRSCPRVF